jgi:hypothetical protein
LYDANLKLPDKRGHQGVNQPGFTAGGGLHPQTYFTVSCFTWSKRPAVRQQPIRKPFRKTLVAPQKRRSGQPQAAIHAKQQTVQRIHMFFPHRKIDRGKRKKRIVFWGGEGYNALRDSYSIIL